MDIFINFLNLIGDVIPDFVPLIVCPALLLLLAVIFTLFGGRKAYKYCALSIGGVAFFLMVCIADVRAAFAFIGLYTAGAFLLRLLLFLPCPVKYTPKKQTQSRRDEEIYERFHEDLPEQHPEETEEPALDETPSATAEESGMHLAYVTTLLEKLKKEKLSPTDRLEADALSRTVDGYRGKALTGKELRLLNECLASVLKLTAKYKL